MRMGGGGGQGCADPQNSQISNRNLHVHDLHLNSLCNSHNSVAFLNW